MRSCPSGRRVYCSCVAVDRSMSRQTPKRGASATLRASQTESSLTTFCPSRSCSPSHAKGRKSSRNTARRPCPTSPPANSSGCANARSSRGLPPSKVSSRQPSLAPDPGPHRRTGNPGPPSRETSTRQARQPRLEQLTLPEDFNEATKALIRRFSNEATYYPSGGIPMRHQGRCGCWWRSLYS